MMRSNIINHAPEVRKIYYYKPGQDTFNTKVSERSMGMIVPNSTYDRFTNYAKENERIALFAEREAKRLAELRKATHDMSKSWTDTTQNLKKRREEELLAQEELERAERDIETKEMIKVKELERDEVIRQAKELLLYKRPNVRLFNQALLTAECIRERDEQIKFKESMKKVYDDLDKENNRLVYEDVKKFHDEENKKRERIRNNAMKNKEEIQKQIKENEINLKKTQESMRKDEIEDLKNMEREMNEIKENELQLELKKKEELKRMIQDSIEDKKHYQLKAEQDKEFQDKSLNKFKDFKRDVDVTLKQKTKQAMNEKVNRIEILGRRLHKKNELERLAFEEEERKKQEAEEERQKMKELKKIEEKKQKRINAHLQLKEQIKNVEEEQMKRKKEQTDKKLWETLQRYKRNEFNKEFDLQQIKTEKEKRLRYGKILKKQMAEKLAQNKKAAHDDDYGIQFNDLMKKSNDKIISYGEQIIKESEGVRPTYPVAKALGQFKKEIGLIPRKKIEDTEAPAREKKIKGGRRMICTKPMDEKKTFSFS